MQHIPSDLLELNRVALLTTSKNQSILDLTPNSITLDISCDGNFCRNNSTCQMVNMVVEGQNITHAVCQCPEGIYGPYCQYTDFCTTQRPCTNEGNCSLIGYTSYTCRCRDGYFGRNCQFGLF